MSETEVSELNSHSKMSRQSEYEAVKTPETAFNVAQSYLRLRAC